MLGLLITTLILCLILHSWLSLLRNRRAFNIDGPFPLPIIGNGFKFFIKRSEFIPVLRKFKEDFKDACLFYLGHKSYVILSHPKYVEPIFTITDLSTKGRSYQFLKPWLGEGLLTAPTNGKRWKAHRKLLTPAFHFNILQVYLQVFLKNDKILAKKLESYSDGNTFDAFPIIALNALDNITETIMGVSVDAQINSQSKYVKAIDIISQIIALRIRNPLYAPDALFNLTKYKKMYDEALAILHNQSETVIRLRREELKNSNVNSKESSDLGIKNKFLFLDLLLQTEVDGKPINPKYVREEVDTFMFEGHDTTSSAISFILYCISKHKDVQEKIFDEQRSIFGDKLENDPEYADLQQMKYLEMVIKESLRIFPPVPLIERLVTEDTEMAGLHIKADTAVMINILEIQRHPDLYENPLEFIPERFQLNTTSFKNAFNWLAFSAGSRNCIGQKFAMMEMKIMIAGIIKRFKVLPSPDEPILCSDLVLRSENGIKIALIKRE